MDPAIILLLLRFLAAALLLGFLGVIAWLIYQDMRLADAALSERQRQYGVLQVVDHGGEGAATYPLSPVTGIGRAAGNAIVLEDDYVSNEHALLTLRGRQWWLEDLNSRNGTFLNDIAVAESTIVSPGDVITIGDTKLKVEFTPGEETIQ